MSTRGAGPSFRAITLTSNGGRLLDLKTACVVCPAFDIANTPHDQHPALPSFVGLWDTGASGTSITQAVVDKCGLQPFTMKKVQGAYGGPVDRPVYLVNIGLPNGVMIPNLAVVWGEMGGGIDVLIGMDIITLGDFAVTNEKGVTTFSFRIPSLHTIDYAKMANQEAARAGAFQRTNVNPAARQGKHRR